MSTGLYSGASSIALGFGLYRITSGLWGNASGVDAGFGGLALSLDFLSMSSTTMDPRITFSRGSNATLTDSTGKITYAPANLLVRSEEFDNASWTKTRASVTPNATTAPNGTATADKLVEDSSASNTHIVSQTATIAASTSYTFSVYLKASERSFARILVGDTGGNNAVRVDVNLSDGTTASGTNGTGWSFTSASATAVGDGWYRVVVSGANTSATSGVAIVYMATALGTIIYTGNGTYGLYVWGAQLEPVTYQTTPSTYQATTSSAYYGPRFDYDPVTLAAKGLLVEEQRTNLLTYSEQFDNAAWTKASGGTGSVPVVTSNAALAPDGTITADQVVFNLNGGTTSSDWSWIVQSYTATAGTTYSSSVWVRTLSGTAKITMDSASNDSVLYDVTTTWTRISGARLDSVGGSRQLRIGLRGNNVASGQSNSATLLIWGAQLEAGAFATSYIPTVASTVTRSADVATMTGSNFSAWFNAAEGTFVVGADSFVNISAAVYYPVSVSDGTSNNYIGAYEYNGKWGAGSKVANVFQFDLSQASSYTANTPAKTALTYKVNDFAVSVNGNAALTDTSGSVPSVDRLGIGSQNNGGYLNGHVRSIAYYNVRLPNSSLVSLSA